MTVNAVIEKINKNELAKWVCFLGGDPLFQSEFLYEICRNINKPIGIYTGYDYDMVLQKFGHIILLPNVLFLKCGRYEKKLLTIEQFPITSNQKLYLKYSNEWHQCPYTDIPKIVLEVKKILGRNF